MIALNPLDFDTLRYSISADLGAKRAYRDQFMPGDTLFKQLLSVQPSSAPSQRYVYQSFNWNTTRLNNLKSYPSVTYEPEAWFNNQDGRLYLGSSVQSWGSDLPRSYLDTGFADGNKEKGYTVGTAEASGLTANRSYYTMIWTNFGNASSDSGKINGQLGKRIPSFCYSTWCIFAQATTFLVPAWQVAAPGSRSWSN